MTSTATHLRQAVKTLRRSRGYALAFIVTFGLAVGVNSAVFSVVNGVLLKPLPFEGGDRILYLKQPAETAGVENTLFSFMEIDDYRASSRTIDEFVEFGEWQFTVLADNEPHRALGGLVTSNYFDVLGMRTAHGRLLNEEDDVRGAESVVLLTDAYWERTFGADPSIVGRTIDLEGFGGGYVATRVVGVLEPGHHYTGSRQPDFYVNYSVNSHYQDAAMRDARTHRMTDVFARMAPGVTLDQARSELTSINRQLHAEYPDAYDATMNYGLVVSRWQDELTREGRTTFLFLMGAVGIVLLLAAANVANLILTRLMRKENELSTRAALGASRRDLRLHLTAENAILGLAGGALGIVLASASQSALVSYASRFTVRAQEVGIDWTVLGATLGGGVLLAGLLAWLPGLPVDPGVSRVATAQSKATESRVRKQLQRGLIVTQLALSFTLLLGAGLLVRSLVNLTSVDPGFETEQILTLQTPRGPTGVAFPGMEEPQWDVILDEIRGFPGVGWAALASWTPLSNQTRTAVSVLVDDRIDEGDRSNLLAANNVSPDYFRTLGIPLISGRYFTEDDREGTADVAILNESMARAHFGAEDAVGHRIAFSQDVMALRGGMMMEPDWFEIVGVVADSREYSMDEEGAHTVYRPAAQTTRGPAVLIAHVGDPTALTRFVRDAIQRSMPDQAVEEIQSMASLVEQDVAPSRLNAILFGSFAFLALIIAAVGVLGALAFSVSRRVREFGIRMALGADQGSVLRNVLGEGVLLVGIALIVGGAAAVYLGRFLGGLLYGVEPLDPVAVVAAAGVLAVVALGAALIPAVRAVRVDPSEALRAE
ncbi:MAG: ABC transporter permease [Longimicrobiales bacterium]|nr:ABC transporter permease [Longimicrobiales bacterium]